ncbi:hypothetical protein Nmel_018153 [Mimus melanotis]
MLEVEMIPGIAWPQAGKVSGEYPGNSEPCLAGLAGALCCLRPRKAANSTFLQEGSSHEVRSDLPWHRNTPGSLNLSIFYFQVSLHSQYCSGSSLGTVPVLAPAVELPLSSHLQWEESFGLGLFFFNTV